MINEKTIKDLVDWLREMVKDAKANGVVYGLSGGLDSAVIGAISNIAFPDSSLGIIMPIHSLEKDEEDGRLVAEKLGLNIEKVDLTPVYDKLIDVTFEGENLLAKSNIKPRLRMTTLYYYGQENNYLVLGSSNLSEFYTGYFTKHGDTGSDLMPLGDFLKTEVYEMAKLLNIPDEIINKKPSAGLWEGQSDEDEMGFSYEILDKKISGGKISEDVDKKIEKMHNNSEHKRNIPKIYKNEE